MTNSTSYIGGIRNIAHRCGGALAAITRASVGTTLLTAIMIVPATAGYFDCSVVYDEYENLMNKQFLMEPDRFVATIQERLTKEQFAQIDANRFLLYNGREGLGIAVIVTNRNSHGKMLFTWDNVAANEAMAPAFLIEDTVLFGRVKDGYGPRRLPRVHLNPGFAVDVDTGVIGDSDEPGTDIAYVAGEDGIYIQAVNGATLEFPTESLCHKVE
ncbi:MAG: hypothetical protein OEQ39_20145 [Gammaproteobacteria bacterium]|nr:hypothetical protein [Gammaproteobacteria bacterium]MDH3464436.1 hypothetical protein [Gammaproteobacteria bacterium]